MIHNKEIAEILRQVAEQLSLRGENQYRIRACNQAALFIEGYSQSIADLVKKGQNLENLPGIGDSMAGKISTIVKTGSLPQLEELRREVPSHLADLMTVSGLGPKRVNLLHENLHIDDIDGLEAAARGGKLRRLPGFGEKSEKNILEGIARFRRGQERHLWVDAEELVTPLLASLKAAGNLRNLTICGSFRRKQETVHDIDILATVSGKTDLMDRLVSHKDVTRVVSHGPTRSTVILHDRMQADLRVVDNKSYGAALVYFTGSKAHVVALRAMAVKKNLKINEYGIFRGKRHVGGKTEKEVYDAVKLPVIEPELRENRGEIEFAKKNAQPRLVTEEDIRGDLHAHTDHTDGRNSLREMAEAARDLGYEYLAITDHSPHVRVARGQDVRRLRAELEEIDHLNSSLRGITLLKGAEVDILENGSLDYPDEALRELDLAVCSIHSRFSLPARKQTDRLLRALDNRHCTILGHPRSRHINKRPPIDADMERVFRAARECGCVLEVNGQPDRLDLNDIDCRTAKEAGCSFALSTDAHTTDGLFAMRHALGQARRGWLEAADIANTRPLASLRKLLRK